MSCSAHDQAFVSDRAVVNAVPPESRTVVVIRHAHAGKGRVDHERELDERGRREATATGRWLDAHALDFDLVLVSDAVRTRQTWSLIAAELTDPPEPVFDERAYACDLDGLLDLMLEDRARVPVVAVVGHNPAVSELAWYLAGHDGPELVPGAAAVITAGTDAGLSPGHIVAGFSG